MDGRAEEVAAHLVKLVVDHEPECPVEVVRVASSAHRMEDADHEHLVLEVAPVLLHAADVARWHAQLALDLLLPLVHQPFEVAEDQGAPAEARGDMQTAHRLARACGRMGDDGAMVLEALV